MSLKPIFVTIVPLSTLFNKYTISMFIFAILFKTYSINIDIEKFKVYNNIYGLLKRSVIYYDNDSDQSKSNQVFFRVMYNAISLYNVMHFDNK